MKNQKEAEYLIINNNLRRDYKIAIGFSMILIVITMTVIFLANAKLEKLDYANKTCHIENEDILYAWNKEVYLSAYENNELMYISNDEDTILYVNITKEFCKEV